MQNASVARFNALSIRAASHNDTSLDSLRGKRVVEWSTGGLKNSGENGWTEISCCSSLLFDSQGYV